MNGFVIKVTMKGEKRARLLAGDGRTTRLRIHAISFEDREKAVTFAKQLEKDNPGVKARAEAA